MTRYDFVAFSALVARLARSFHRKADDEMVVDLFEDLQRFDLAAIEQVAAQLRGQKFFPKLHDWREQLQMVEAREAERTRRSLFAGRPVDGDGEVAAYHCATCQDTGWAPACGCAMDLMDLVSGRCPAHGAEGGEQSAQAYKACGCRSWNPAWRSRGIGRAAELGAA